MTQERINGMLKLYERMLGKLDYKNFNRAIRYRRILYEKMHVNIMASIAIEDIENRIIKEKLQKIRDDILKLINELEDDGLA